MIEIDSYTTYIRKYLYVIDLLCYISTYIGLSLTCKGINFENFTSEYKLHVIRIVNMHMVKVTFQIIIHNLFHTTQVILISNIIFTHSIFLNLRM